MFNGEPTLTDINQAIIESATKAHRDYHGLEKGQIDPELISMRSSDAGTTDYQLTISTSNVRNAGTQANVFATLFNKKGQSTGVMNLTKELCTTKNEGPFNRGATDVFVIKNCSNIGFIERLRLGHDNVGMTASWMPKNVVVKDLTTSQEFSFECSVWLTTYDGGQTVRDFEVVRQYSLAPGSYSEEVTLENGVVDYAPKVFRNIREFYKIHSKEYIKSWNLETDKLEMKEGAGRSGSLFLKSNDSKYMMKTIPLIEVETFLGILQNFYEHLMENPKSLIMRIIGMHKVKSFYIIVFCNCLYHPDSLAVHSVYDLKGRKPKAGKQFQNTDKGQGYVFKDKDLDRKFQLRDMDKMGFMDILKIDLEFFAMNNLMDYSFLIGVSQKTPEDPALPEFSCPYDSSEDFGEVYQIGFIDCLTNYNLKKKTAHMLKRTMWTSEELSTVDARSYSDRIGLFLIDLFEDEQRAKKRLTISSSSTGPNNVKIELLESQVYLLQKQVTMLTRTVQKLEQAHIEKTAEKIKKLTIDDEEDDNGEDGDNKETPSNANIAQSNSSDSTVSSALTKETMVEMMSGQMLAKRESAAALI